MFSNVEKKIQTVAKVLCVMGLVLAVIYTIICVAAGMKLQDYGGGELMIVGPIAGLLIFLSVLIGAWMLYGFGEIIGELKESNYLLRTGLAIEEEEENEGE